MKAQFASKNEQEFYDYMIELEEKLLKSSGLTPWKDLWIFNAPIIHNSQSNYIHTIKCGTKGPNLLLIHGYGGSGIAFFQMLKELSEHFIVYTIDLLGMGLSSRPPFEATSTEETIDFFVSSIEQWRVYIGLEHFHLAGHSLGGYISVCYTETYPTYVKSLILLSPGGITERTTEENRLFMENVYKRSNLKFRLYLRFSIYSAKKKATPHAMIRKFSLLGKFLFKRLINNKAKDLNSETLNNFRQYFMDIVTLPPGSEDSVHYLFEVPMGQGKIPKEKILETTIQKKTLFLFGEIDTMESLGARRLFKSNPGKFQLKVVKNSTHQLTLDNPSTTNSMIIEFISEFEKLEMN